MTDTTMLAQAVQLFNAAACEHHTRCGYGDPSCNACTAAGLEAALPLLLAAVVDEARVREASDLSIPKVAIRFGNSDHTAVVGSAQLLEVLQSAATRVLAAQPQQEQQEQGKL